MYCAHDIQLDLIQARIGVFCPIVSSGFMRCVQNISHGEIRRYVTGEVSSSVMKADERIIEARARLEAVETLLKDQRIGPELREEIRGHFHVSQSSTAVDQASLFRSVVALAAKTKI